MKISHLFRFAALLLIFTCFSNSAIADVIQQKDTVTGIVIDKKKQPLPGAKVEIVGQSYSAFTDLDGRFNIKCDPGAKKVLVTYPKLRAAKKKIKPDMTVQIGRSWKQNPEHFQWFVGANIGIGLTETYTSSDNFYYNDYEDDFVSPTISVMAGRVREVGWYVKAFVNPSVRMIDPDWSDFPDNKCSNFGAILGGMLRLGCPLHLYLGGGFVRTNFSNLNKVQYNYSNYGWQIDIGLLFRIKDNFGINWSMNLGGDTKHDAYMYGSFSNLGVCYFFDK
ncbi:MAG: carboxypeptidase-like regulatory domain-containing protein [Muribaculaceae bacterium]|nr:carboxypeptidase-like regulatory domain-containing protein [Muribaculaceae bacterium]